MILIYSSNPVPINITYGNDPKYRTHTYTREQIRVWCIYVRVCACIVKRIKKHHQNALHNITDTHIKVYIGDFTSLIIII